MQHRSFELQKGYIVYNIWAIRKMHQALVLSLCSHPVNVSMLHKLFFTNILNDTRINTV